MRVVYWFCLITVFLHASQESSLIQLSQEKNWSSQKLLVKAIKQNDIAVAEYALQNGAQVSEYKWEQAAKNKESAYALTALFLSYGAAVNPKECRWTPLVYMAKEGRYQAVQLLLQARAKVHVQYGWDDRTPLHEAVNSHFHYIIYALINADSDTLLGKDTLDQNPVHSALGLLWSACTRKHKEEIERCVYTLKILLFFAHRHNRLVAVLAQKNSNNKTPKDIVHTRTISGKLLQFLEECEQERPEALEELIDAGTQFEHELLMKELGAKKQNLSTWLAQREVMGGKIKY